MTKQEIHRAKITQAKIGKKLSEAHKRAISLGKKGVGFSTEHRAHISNALKNYWASETPA